MDNATFDIDICRQCRHKDCRYCRFNPDNRLSDPTAVTESGHVDSTVVTKAGPGGLIRKYYGDLGYWARDTFTLCGGITDSYRYGLQRDTI